MILLWEFSRWSLYTTDGVYMLTVEVHPDVIVYTLCMGMCVMSVYPSTDNAGVYGGMDVPASSKPQKKTKKWRREKKSIKKLFSCFIIL